MSTVNSNPSDGSSESIRYIEWRIHLEAFVDEMERRRIALPLSQGLRRSTGVYWALDFAEWNRASNEIHRGVSEDHDCDQMTPRLMMDVATVNKRCAEVDQYVDWVASNISRLMGLLPTSWFDQ